MNLQTNMQKQQTSPGFPATYLHCSMAGSYHIDCTIDGWDTGSKQFLISYFDFITEETDSDWVDYKYVTDWTWPNLLAHFATQS